MKLLMCKHCGDVFNLTFDVKSCSCGKVAGRYKNAINAVYIGEAVPLCFDNRDLKRACFAQSKQDKQDGDVFYGQRFEAWICPANSETFIRGSNQLK